MAPFDIAEFPDHNVVVLQPPSLLPVCGVPMALELTPELTAFGIPTPHTRPSPLPPPANPVGDVVEICGLPTVWRRARWTENLLQLVDKDSAVTAVVFICFYVGLLQAL